MTENVSDLFYGARQRRQKSKPRPPAAAELDQLIGQLDRGVLGRNEQDRPVPMRQRLGAISGAIDHPRFDEALRKGQYSTQRLVNILDAGVKELRGEKVNWDFPKGDALFDAPPDALKTAQLNARKATAGQQPSNIKPVQLATNRHSQTMSDADPSLPVVNSDDENIQLAGAFLDGVSPYNSQNAIGAVEDFGRGIQRQAQQAGEDLDTFGGGAKAEVKDRFYVYHAALYNNGLGSQDLYDEGLAFDPNSPSTGQTDARSRHMHTAGRAAGGAVIDITEEGIVRAVTAIPAVGPIVSVTTDSALAFANASGSARMFIDRSNNRGLSELSDTEKTALANAYGVIALLPKAGKIVAEQDKFLGRMARAVQEEAAEAASTIASQADDGQAKSVLQRTLLAGVGLVTCQAERRTCSDEELISEGEKALSGENGELSPFMQKISGLVN